MVVQHCKCNLKLMNSAFKMVKMAYFVIYIILPQFLKSGKNSPGPELSCLERCPHTHQGCRFNLLTGYIRVQEATNKCVSGITNWYLSPSLNRYMKKNFKWEKFNFIWFSP